ADAAISDALLGRSLGNFQVERILGVGGMGMVFAARHKTIGQQAVVKVLSPEMMRIRDAKTRFLNEAKLASAINHPNIVRIFDFGIAKAAEQPGHERLTQQGMVIGTPRYMAPEQACGDPVDPRTDVYALGVIAYELVSGHTPYQTSRLVELVNRQMHMPVP